jgi:hypothetical protein
MSMHSITNTKPPPPVMRIFPTKVSNISAPVMSNPTAKAPKSKRVKE